ncbi:ATP-binding protein [Flectobacillus longus]|jgi:predicted AAA+ superfamily ATPase|uniref:ATP-binding protein n=1 Tax=Flectobacillus longus TaxID=2984207 RepID=UPI0024B7A364|nr:ATP-binding protein [Flectobacillus longus]MDI9882335.1 ATP-binding protein [Flectobacillus longus]
MIKRKSQLEIIELLEEFPAVSILGPRQVGKTTLAEEIANILMPEAIYLDLESLADQAKLSDSEAYFELHKGKLIILDEIQRTPELFAVLRGVIDRRRRAGFRTCQFLILGSASLELLKQSSESLAGRIAYQELSGFNVLEIEDSSFSSIESLWLRGGFPDSFLAKNDAGSFRWRQNFIVTYLERDVPQFGSRIPAISLRRLWTMLAHTQGSQLNTAQLGASLGITIPTVKRYIELLEDLFLVRTIYPWSGNVGKRLVKTPKVYIRDSGLTHALLNLNSLEDLLSHPVVGPSWEGFVIENIISCLPQGATFWFYRTSAGAEIDLVVELTSQERYAIEVKRSSAPKVSKGFYLGCEDIKATKRYVVYPGKEQFPFADGVIATPLSNLMKELSEGK